MRYRSWLLAGMVAQAGAAQAMGLGEMDVRSYLGSPLQAQLSLFSPGPYDQEDIRIRIARPEIYQRMGAQYEPFHSQIAFDVDRDAQGRVQVRASSRNRVTEPFLDIVVELSWPAGTTYRRYTLLLDPPEYALRWQNRERRPQVLEPAAVQLASRPTPAVVPVQPKPVRTASRAPAPALVEGQPYRVRSGDTLWKIARQLAGNGNRSVHAMMQTLYAANPDAFIQGDRDRLKVGAVLQLPSASTLPATVAQAPAPAERAPVAAPAQPAPVDEKARILAELQRLQQEKLELQQHQQQLKTELASVLEQYIASTEAGRPAATAQPQAAVAQPMPVPVTAPHVAQAVERDITEMRVHELLAMADTGPVAEAELPVPGRLHGGFDKHRIGLWSLLGMLPLGVLAALMGMRSRARKLRVGDKAKDIDLHDKVFGSHRDRSRQESPAELQKALHQIREKADSHGRQRQQQQVQETLDARDDLKQIIDLYLIYSQYQKALNVILTEISKRPSDIELRLYLMQVYAAMGDWQAFEQQEDVLRRLGQETLLEQARQMRELRQAG